MIVLVFVSGHCDVEQVERSKRNNPEEIQLEPAPLSRHQSGFMQAAHNNTSTLSTLKPYHASTTSVKAQYQVTSISTMQHQNPV